MIPLKFQRKLRKVGESWVVTVPMAFANIIDKSKEYSFIMMEVEKSRKGRARQK